MVGVVSGAAWPVLLIAGWTVADMLQLPSFSQVTDTVSALAATGATDRWVMTLVFVVLGVCDVVAAAALRPAAPAGRLVLIAGAGSGVLVAAFLSIPGVVRSRTRCGHCSGSPDWRHGLARRRGQSVPWALRPAGCAGAVAAVQFVFVAWFAAELITAPGRSGWRSG